MAEKSPRKTSGAAMARALRQERPAMAAIRRNLSRLSSPEDIDAGLRAMAPVAPSAEYVALANEAAGNPGMGPETVAAGRADEQEHGGMYGALPLARGASARLPAHLGPMPQGSPVGAEAVARARARMAGVQPPGAGVVPSFAGARASGSAAQGVDPRMLAALLRAGR